MISTYCTSQNHKQIIYNKTFVLLFAANESAPHLRFCCVRCCLHVILTCRACRDVTRRAKWNSGLSVRTPLHLLSVVALIREKKRFHILGEAKKSRKSIRQYNTIKRRAEKDLQRAFGKRLSASTMADII